MGIDKATFEQAAKQIRREDMVKLLKRLVNIKSPFFEEAAIIDYLYRRFSQYKRLHTQIHHFEEKKITGFKGKNLIVRLRGKNSGSNILLNAHVDTVPLCSGWTVDPYSGVEKKGRFYGLGALDMKAGVVMCVFLIEALVKSGVEPAGDVVFTAVSGEEGPFGLGTHYAILDGILQDCNYAIIPEPTAPLSTSDNKFPCIALGGRGTAIYNVQVKGKSAHGAYPKKGINAVEDAARLIATLTDKLDLGTHELLGDGSMCITNLRGGEKYLLVPEEASFTIYRHTVEGDAARMLQEVQDIVNSLNLKSQVEVKLRDLPHPDTFYLPWTVDRNSDLVQSLERACYDLLSLNPKHTYFRSESDANHVAARLEIPTVIFGPDGANYHAADEYVEIDTMVDATQVMLYTVLDLMSQ